MEKDSSAYFEQISLEFRGNLDPVLFEKGWNKIADRHDVLRTLFVHDFRIPLQIVLRHRSIDFNFEDIRTVDDKDKYVMEIKAADRKKTFNLQKDRLFRVKVLQIEDDRFISIFSFYHIILDGWCAVLLISEFMECYEMLLGGKKPDFDMPPSYSKYIEWLNKQDKSVSGEFWKRYLDDYKKPVSVPDNRPITYSGNEEQMRYSFSLSRSISDAAKKFYLNTIGMMMWFSHIPFPVVHPRSRMWKK
jgi:hypothetical protein